MVKRIISILLSIFLLFDLVYADELELKSERYILYNMNDDRVILENKSNEQTYIASLTKIMTAIVAIENNDNFDKKVTITYDMLKDIEWDVSVVGFSKGETVTYNDLLYGTLMCSGADAVNALAIDTSGSIKEFVNLMNKKVDELGLKNTKFANPVGLFDINNYSSAYDTAQILKYALKNEKFKEVFTAKKYTFSNGKEAKSTIEHYNKKANKDINYITGSKTGYISKAGYCLASTATINNIDYLLVTLNAFNDSTAHITDSAKIYEYFSQNYGYQNIVNKDDIIVTLDTLYSKEKNVDIKSNINKNYYLKNDFNKDDITYKYDGINEISYFTKKGTKLGKVDIIYDNEILDSFDLIYNESLKFSLLSYLLGHKILTLLSIFIMFIIYRIIKINIKRRKRKRRK